MDTEQYRKANELADLIDFWDGITETAKDREVVAKLRSRLADQERIDGKPADPKEKRRGFCGG